MRTLTVAAVASTGAYAAQPKAASFEQSFNKPSKSPRIEEVFLSWGSQTLLIVGEGFDFDPATLKVLLGVPSGDPTDTGRGDITDSANCTLTAAEEPQEITCDMSTIGMPPAGDYRLVVASDKYSDEYALTVGAAGPEGPEGPIGPMGPPAMSNPNLYGPACPSPGSGETDLVTIEVRRSPLQGHTRVWVAGIGGSFYFYGEVDGPFTFTVPVCAGFKPIFYRWQMRSDYYSGDYYSGTGVLDDVNSTLVVGW